MHVQRPHMTMDLRQEASTTLYKGKCNSKHHLKCRHHGQILVVMHELQPLLVPPDNSALQLIGLQRFKHYFEVLAGAVKVLQGNAAATHEPLAAHTASRPEDCCHWTNLTGPAVNVLNLVAQMTTQLPVAACHEVI